MTQGYLVSPTISSIVVDAVVSEVLLEVCRPQKAHPGLCWEAREDSTVFYAEDRFIASCNTILVQTTLMALARMFEKDV